MKHYLVACGVFAAVASSCSQTDPRDSDDPTGFEAPALQSTHQSLNSIPAGESWVPIGPTPMTWRGIVTSGRGTVLAVNPVNANQVWYGTATGGLWLSENALSDAPTFRAMADGAAAMPVGSIALRGCTVDRCDEVYFGTGENSFRRDTFYGAGVYKLAFTAGEFPGYQLSEVGTSRAKFGGGSITGLVVEGSEIFVTVSAGQTGAAAQATVVHPLPAAGLGVFTSKDAGATWSSLALPGIDPALFTDLAMGETTPNVRNPNLLYVGVEGHGLFRGTRSGPAVAWTFCPLNFASAGCPAPDPDMPARGSITAPNFDHVEVALKGGRVYVAYGHNSSFTAYTSTVALQTGADLYRSSDNGTQWVKTATTEKIQIWSRYTHLLEVDPHDADHVMLGGIGLWESRNAGDSFSAISQLSSCGHDGLHDDQHAFAFADNGANQVFFSANDGGFFTSDNGGANWNARGNESLQTAQFYALAIDDVQESLDASGADPVGTGAVLGGTQDNGTMLWNGGRAWFHQVDGDGGDAKIIDRNVMLGTSQIGGLERTDTGPNFANFTTFRDGLPAPSAEDYSFYAPISAVGNQVFIASNRVYRQQGANRTFTAVSPQFDTSGSRFSDIETGNVVTAMTNAPSAAGRMYVGLYDGQIWRTDSPSVTSWTRVRAAPRPCSSTVAGNPTLGNLAGNRCVPVSSLAVHPTNSSIVVASFSGFGAGGNLWKSTDAGATWSSLLGNLPPDLPLKVVKFDKANPSVLYLGADDGVYKTNDGGASWDKYTLANGMPSVPVFDIEVDSFRGRVFAATHGRGVYMLAQTPSLRVYEGWMMGEIWDVLLYGEGWGTKGTACNVDLITQQGNICTHGNIDSFGDTAIKVGDKGMLATSRPFHWDDKPVVAACLDGKCVGPTPISTCLVPGDLVSSVRVTCGARSALAKLGKDAPQQINPPASVLEIEPAEFGTDVCQTGAPVAGSFRVLAALSATSPANGGERVLCGAEVNYGAGATSQDMAIAARDAINSTPTCIAKGVVAKVPPAVVDGEDAPPDASALMINAPTVTGGQLVSSLRVNPGAGKNLCYTLRGLSNLAANQLTIMELAFDVPSSGAKGGVVSVTESSPLGVCRVQANTQPGWTSAQVASAVSQAYQAATVAPGTAGCSEQANPADMVLTGNKLVSVAMADLTVCSTDSAVGVRAGPEGLDLCPFVPEVKNQTITRCVPKQAEERLSASIPSCLTATGVTLTGKIRTVNGVTLATPIAVSGTDPRAVLPMGVTTIDWTMTSGSQTSTATQTVRVVEQSTTACCAPGQRAIVGTSGIDVFITLPNEALCVFGLEAADLIVTGLLPDYLSGGPGDDSITTGTAGDVAVGGDGNDVITLPIGSGSAYGGAGNDVIEITGGGLVYGNDGNDAITTILGDHTIYPGPGRDNVYAGIGNDSVYIHDVCELQPLEVLVGGLGNDTLYTPLPLIDLWLRGVSVVGFENIVVTTTNRHLSECFKK